MAATNITKPRCGQNIWRRELGTSRTAWSAIRRVRNTRVKEEMGMAIDRKRQRALYMFVS
jgi:hypothetical protein